LTTWDISHRRPGWETHVHVEAQMTCDASAFHFSARIVAQEDGVVVSERNLHETVPRLFV
jgi:hypothetical protein